MNAQELLKSENFRLHFENRYMEWNGNMQSWDVFTTIGVPDGTSVTDCSISTKDFTEALDCLLHYYDNLSQGMKANGFIIKHLTDGSNHKKDHIQHIIPNAAREEIPKEIRHFNPDGSFKKCEECSFFHKGLRTPPTNDEQKLAIGECNHEKIAARLYFSIHMLCDGYYYSPKL